MFMKENVESSKSINRYFFYAIIYLGDIMKALTIKEPWASLIINGYKTYEFRSWKTNYRGKILIHAGKSLERDMGKRFKEYNLEYKCGYIIGEAYLADVILVDKKLNDELKRIDPLVYGHSNHIEKYAWKLDNIIKYDKPIETKGKLGLWNYTEPIMIHLDNEWFLKIKNKSKTYELRLYDEKRRKIKENDIIIFENRLDNDTIKTRVIGLHIFKNFKELINNIDYKKCGFSEVNDYTMMDKFYSKVDQDKYGVIAIEIELLK